MPIVGTLSVSDIIFDNFVSTHSSTTEKIDVRGRGRAVKIKYETNTVDDTAWRLGSTKLQLRPVGRR